MTTVGDIARSTAEQIEVYPIPPPKLANIQKALSLYQERLVTSPSLSPIIGNSSESLTPIASTSEETIGRLTKLVYEIENPLSARCLFCLAISDGTFTKESSAWTSAARATITDPHHPSYDVDTMIDSLDYERLYLNQNKDIDEQFIPSSASQTDFIRARCQMALAKRDECISPHKRRLSSSSQDEQDNVSRMESEGQDQVQSSSQLSSITITLGERLQKAAEVFQMKGHLPFDEDYITLVRQLFSNSSLTHLEQLHLKSLFLDN